MDPTKLNMIKEYLALGWALVPLHHVTGISNGVDPVCSCRMATGCKSAGKHPRLSAWQQEANLVRALDTFLAWPAETNWGLATGRASGVWALDVDPKNGGDEAVAQLIATGVVNQTRVHWTGSRGRHLLYAMPDDFTPTNRTGALPPGIDVRGDGGQIVLPPSVSGVGRYERSERGNGEFDDVAPASAALLGLIRPPAPAPHVPRTLMRRIDPGGRYATYARAAVDGELRALRETHSSRNSRAWAAACRILELCHAQWSWLDIDEEYDRWRGAGHDHPDGVSVPPSELDAVWRSATRHVAGRQADAPPDKPWPPAGDADVLDFLRGPTGSGTTVGPPTDVFAPIPSGTTGGSPWTQTRPTGQTSSLTLPEEFWAARPVLRHIRQAAHARVVSGDVLLHSVLARLASLWPHTVRLHSGVGSGSGASANLYVAVVGPSGAGKTSGVSVAREMLPVPHWLKPDDYAEDWPLGTGEGIAESFMGSKRVSVDDKSTDVKTGLPKMHSVRTQVRHNALLHADEGEVLTRMLQRQGAIIGETLRRGWTGGTLGQANGRQETTRIIKDGRYSLGLVIGFQPETAQPLLADVAAGTPQRFLWCWALDPAVPDVLPAAPGPLTAVWRAARADPADTVGGTGWIVGDPFSDVDQAPVSFDPAIVAGLVGDRAARVRGEESAQLPTLDAHMPLMLVKVAALLAQLDGRRAVGAEDWRLAGMVWATSCAVRDHSIELGRAQRGKERAGEIRHHADREGAAEAARLQVRDGAFSAQVARVARRLADQVVQRKDVQRAELRRLVTSKDRGAFEDALSLAIENGWVARDEAHLAPGPMAPS